MKIAIIIAISRRRLPEEPARPRQPIYRAETHSARCQAAHAAHEAWARAWPHHCPTCAGAGEVSFDDDPGASDCSLSAGSMTFTDPCDCVMEDRCPRCGQDLRGSWLRHPGRRLGGMLQDGLGTLDWNLRSLVGNAVALAVRAGVPNLRLRNYVMARLSHLLTGPLMRLTAPAWRLSERLNPTRDETPPCDHCGWTGTNPGDVQPPWECLCHADYEAELHAQMAAGACCWRCEQPFDGDRPGVQAKLPIFGVRWLHPGCLFEDERAIEPPATDPTA